MSDIWLLVRHSRVQLIPCKPLGSVVHQASVVTPLTKVQVLDCLHRELSESHKAAEESFSLRVALSVTPIWGQGQAPGEDYSIGKNTHSCSCVKCCWALYQWSYTPLYRVIHHFIGFQWEEVCKVISLDTGYFTLDIDLFIILAYVPRTHGREN